MYATPHLQDGLLDRSARHVYLAAAVASEFQCLPLSCLRSNYCPAEPARPLWIISWPALLLHHGQGQGLTDFANVAVCICTGTFAALQIPCGDARLATLSLAGRSSGSRPGRFGRHGRGDWQHGQQGGAYAKVVV